MAKLLSGGEVSAAIIRDCAARRAELRAKGIRPALAIVRCGARPDDLSYEKGIERSAAGLDIDIRKFLLPEPPGRQLLSAVIDKINLDRDIHGCLIFRPLPGMAPEEQEQLCSALAPEKDVDCCTAVSAAGVFTGRALGFPPCTAQACIELLKHYGTRLRGKQAVVIGRSLVVGRPAAMLMLAEDATVTLCHSRSRDLADICRRADIIVSAAGRPGLISRDFVRPGQVLLDVSMNWDGSGFVGDAVYDEVEPVVSAITPVPGGIGAVTTAVLMKHLILAAERSGC